MAVNGTVRGLKGTITKLKEEIAGLAQKLEDATRYAEDQLEEKNEVLRQRDAAVREPGRADSAAQAHKARADELEKELFAIRNSEADAQRRLKVAELEQARLNGYVQRVAEDDAVREGLVEAADSRSIPRRPAPPLSPVTSYGGLGTSRWGIDIRDSTMNSDRGARRY